MAMSILMRKQKNENLFREALLELIESDGIGDEIILSSGYIDHKILNDKKLAVAIMLGLPKGGRVNILCGNFWKKDKEYNNYLSFKTELEKQLSIRNDIIVDFYYVDKYHAKVALKKDKGIVIGGIMGSSNLTEPAFSDNANIWNKEVDIYILEDSVVKNSSFVCSKAREEKENLQPTISAFYEAFKSRCYALDIIPVDSRFPDIDILTRFYDEIKFFLKSNNKVN
jgi:phosphatidylserine/phosphatidylglycerophosphate/cardiolipin synthase-like enzyme